MHRARPGHDRVSPWQRCVSVPLLTQTKHWNGAQHISYAFLQKANSRKEGGRRRRRGTQRCVSVWPPAWYGSCVCTRVLLAQAGPLAVDRDSDHVPWRSWARALRHSRRACPRGAERAPRVCPARASKQPPRGAQYYRPVEVGCQVPVRDGNGREALWRPFAGMRRLLFSGHGQRGGMAGGQHPRQRHARCM